MKSKIVYPVETQGFENHILLRDTWGQIREYPLGQTMTTGLQISKK